MAHRRNLEVKTRELLCVTWRLLLAGGCDRKRGGSDRSLYGAVRAGDLSVCSTCLFGEPTLMRRSGGDTPLHTAAAYGRMPIVHLLIQYGADVNAIDEERTALHSAVSRDQEDTAKLLIGYGANVNAAMDNGDTPLHVAATAARWT